MRNIKTIIFCTLILISNSLFSQNELTQEYRNEMGMSIDELSSFEKDVVLKFATQLTQEDDSKKIIARISEYLSESDKQLLLKFIKQQKSSPIKSKSTIPCEPIAMIEIMEKEFDCGNILNGEIFSHVYKVKNIGNVPLKIDKVRGACSCTTQDWSKAQIAPDETTEILVKFNSSGRTGAFNKRITITANTFPSDFFMSIKGNVLKKED